MEFQKRDIEKFHTRIILDLGFFNTSSDIKFLQPIDETRMLDQDIFDKIMANEKERSK